MAEPRTILVVDDDPRAVAQLRPALSQRGFAVAQAGTLRAAGEALAAQRPALMIVDGLLPDGKGTTFIEQARQAGLRIPIIYVAALWKDLQAFRRLGERLDLALVTHKPVVPELLAEEVALLLAPAHEEIEVTICEEDFVPGLAPPGRELQRLLPGVLAELLCAVTLAQSTGDPASFADARRIAGRVRVAAGAHGADELAGIAAHIEDALGSLGLEDEETQPLLWREIEHHLDAAMQAARDAAPAALEMDSRGRVLVVDPDATTAQRLVELGRELELDVTVAQSAADAVARARQLRPDCAVVRHTGPERAAELVRALREVPGCEALPVALTTDREQRALAAGAGASLVLALPIDPLAFPAAIRKLMAIARPRRARVLVVDDDPHFARQAAAVLGREGIATVHLDDPRRIIEVLGEIEPDLVLVDSVMPGLSGLDVCRLLRTSQRWQDLPIIYMTVELGLGARLAAFSAGVDDYLARPVVGPELLARVRVRVERARLLRDRTSVDPLTGLLSRRAFHDAAVGRLAEARRAGRPLTISLLDLDGMGDLNDRFGHAAGDHVLAALGRLIGSRLRAEDLRGRWGGDEVALLFAGHDAETSDLVIGRLMAAFDGLAFRAQDGGLFHVTMTSGTAVFPDDGVTLEALYAVAGRRLNLKKRAGLSALAVA